MEDREAAIASTSLLDTAAALRRLAGRRHLLERAQGLFRERGAGVGPTLARHLEAGDLVAVERLAHDLRSSAATIGATALSVAAAELELAAHRGDGVEVRALAPAFLEQIDGVLAELAHSPHRGANG